MTKGGQTGTQAVLIDALYSLPEYDRAVAQALQELHRVAMRASSKVLQEIRFVEKEELSDSLVGQSGEHVVPGRWSLSDDLTLSVHDTLSAKYALPFQRCLECIEEHTRQLENSMMEHVLLVSRAAAPNNEESAPTDVYSFVKAKLKIIHLEFDEDCNPITHNLSLTTKGPNGPQKTAFSDLYFRAPEALKVEIDEILAERKEAYSASRPIRRLPRRNY